MNRRIARRSLLSAAASALVAAVMRPAFAVAAPSLAQAPVPRLPRSYQPLSAEQRDIYARAFAAFDADRFAEAHQLAQAGNHPLAQKIFLWTELQSRSVNLGFEEVSAFLTANPDWPNPEALVRRAEEALVDRSDDGPVLAWFATRSPATTDGTLRYIDALARAGDRAKVAALVRSTWHGAGFGAVQEQNFLARYGDYLTRADHWARLDRLLWDGRRDEAHRMLPRVDKSRQLLADARLKLATQAPGAEAAVRKVPAELVNDAGLAFERLRWRRRRGQDDGARDIMLQAPRDLVRPDLWWAERAFLARRAIQQGRAAEAYRIARDHRNTTGTPFTEGEFLAGWIALRYQNDPRTALAHFNRLNEAARTPITRARGAYWAGRAADALKDARAATDWFTRAATSSTTYHGQLAMARLAASGRPQPWPQIPAPSSAERDAFERGELARAAILLTEIGTTGRIDRVKLFTNRLATIATTPAQQAMAADLALSLSRPDLAVAAAKRSAQFSGEQLTEQ